jgi:nucleoside-diphosphate-sugar epimerase
MINQKVKNVLVTGSEGYIGSVIIPLLINRGYNVVGYDTCFYYEGNLTGFRFPKYRLIKKDLRNLEYDDLNGINAVIHLAALSNDPLGKLDESLTYDINYRASVRLGEIARDHGIEKFIFASSCSLYGALLDEESPSNPQTVYGKSKIMAENELSNLADDTFSPTFMRNATAFGISPRMRFDLVVNNLTGFAKTTGKIMILGDGKPWRPLVHVHDIGMAAIKILESDKELVHNQVFNVGSEKENYQICEIIIAQQDSGDTRDYIVSFEKISKSLGFEPEFTLHRGIVETGDNYERINLDTILFESNLYTRLKQINYLLESNQLTEKLFWNKNRLQ